MSSIAIVPARGGSKRIPRKNVRDFLGVPLIVRTLETLRGSGLFDRVVVSTDDEQIAAIALGAGAEVPFTRPALLSGDGVATAPVVAHAIEELRSSESIGEPAICVAYPAAVFATVEDLRAAKTVLETVAGTDYVATACAFSAPIERALHRTEDGSCELVAPEHRSTRTQDLPVSYHDAGQFYWGPASVWLEQRPMFTNSTQLHVLPRWRVEDIDTPEDWARAELLFRLLQHRD